MIENKIPKNNLTKNNSAKNNINNQTINKPNKQIKTTQNSTTNANLLQFYHEMLLIRRFEEKAGQLYGMGLICRILSSLYWSGSNSKRNETYHD